MRHLFLSFSVCVSLLQAKKTNLPLMATTTHSMSPPTTNHWINPNPQINPHHGINLAPTNQPTPWNQPTPTTSKPRLTQPHLERLVSNVALAVEATFREHVHDTFDEALRKTAMVELSSSSRHSPLLKWRSRVKKRRRGIEKERGKQCREALHKGEWEREK